MNKLLTFVGSVIGGYAGWYLGEAIGLQFLGCFVLSGFCSLAGIVLGWKLAQRIG
jgi:hypothetical protein